VGDFDVGREAAGVPVALRLHAAQRVPHLLRLEDADGLAIDEEEVVCRTGGERELADSYPAARGEVRLVSILDRPAGIAKPGVDIDAGALLGIEPFGRDHGFYLVSFPARQHVPCEPRWRRLELRA